jgi:hypothetical protein
MLRKSRKFKGPKPSLALDFLPRKEVDVGFTMIEFVGCFANNDTPPNSLKDSDANSKVKTLEEEGVGRGTLFSSQHFGGKNDVLEL